MSKFGFYSHATIQENYECLLYRKIPNTAFLYEETPIRFRCFPASNKDKKSYRVTKGVIGEKDSIFIIASNLPTNIDPDDRVVFMGKTLNVESVGFYLNESGIVDASIMSFEYLQARSPKGITLKW